jgi:hypothetical protein
MRDINQLNQRLLTLFIDILRIFSHYLLDFDLNILEHITLSVACKIIFDFKNIIEKAWWLIEKILQGIKHERI